MADEVLDDPTFVGRRERFWTAMLTDQRYATKNHSAIAERDGTLIGIAMAGPVMDDDAQWDWQLYILYTYAAVHASGAGAALLNVVVDPETSAGLWVADPNPRAQAFYRKHGFCPDGTSKVEDGVSEIRMVRR